VKYRELGARIDAMVPRPGRPLGWYDARWRKRPTTTEASYLIVRLGWRRFTIYHTDGRGQASQGMDDACVPLLFRSEGAVCDYVWAQLNERRPQPSASSDPTRTSAEYLAEKRRRLEARFAAREAGEPAGEE